LGEIFKEGKEALCNKTEGYPGHYASVPRPSVFETGSRAFGSETEAIFSPV
jgi:hypothetical protein